MLPFLGIAISTRSSQSQRASNLPNESAVVGTFAVLSISFCGRCSARPRPRSVSHTLIHVQTCVKPEGVEVNLESHAVPKVPFAGCTTGRQGILGPSAIPPEFRHSMELAQRGTSSEGQWRTARVGGVRLRPYMRCTQVVAETTSVGLELCTCPCIIVDSTPLHICSG